MAKTVKRQTRAEVIEWFKDVKFGMFIHWGVYALLGKGEWIRTVDQRYRSTSTTNSPRSSIPSSSTPTSGPPSPSRPA